MALRYLLDTNICIYIANKRPPSVLNKFRLLKIGEVGMSIITYGELLYGAQKSSLPEKSHVILQELTNIISPLPMPNDVAKYYGEIRATLEKQGKIIGNNDLWIAAHALTLGLTLVTNNEKEFSRVHHLNIENWVTNENMS